MNILETIVASKRLEVVSRIQQADISSLKQADLFKRQSLSLKARLAGSETGIIAEFKSRSPSKGIINAEADVTDVTTGYASNGASGLSVLTDQEFFGGSLGNLLSARINNIPVLRKDFIIDAYQLYESKAYGADVILLIAACLTVNETRHLSNIAKDIGLEVLLEIHDETELDHIVEDVDIVGVNNRDLKSFTVDINRSIDLVDLIPSGKIKISESGINMVEDISLLRSHGFRGFLIGEKFMKENDPVAAFVKFMDELHQYEN